MYFTEKQLRIMKFIHRFRSERGISPTMEEIAVNLGVTKITIYDHLNQLERKGALKRERFRARSIELLVDLDEHPNRLVLPLAGDIPADSLPDNGSGSQTLDLGSIFPINKQCFALRVQGNSMLNDHIREGDYVIVEQRSHYINGDTVVVVLSDGRAALRRFRREKSRIRLQPFQTGKRTSRNPGQVVEIRGVVIGLLRNFTPSPQN